MEKILFEINQNCNLNCEYCFYKDYGRSENYLDIDFFRNRSWQKVKEVYITGGEPLLNKDINSIIDFFQNKKITIFTNGILLINKTEEDFKKFIDSVEKIVITLDALDKNYNLRENTQFEVYTIIEKILKYKNKKLEVKIGVNKFNIKKVENTIDKLINLGLKKISINMIHNINGSRKNFKLNSLKEINKILFILYKYENYISLQTKQALKLYFQGNIKELKKTCICGKRFKFINSSGEEFSCPANLYNREKCLSDECINLWEMF